MFRIITVEREYGAGGSVVAAELARRKGWELLDQQLTAEIAKLASVEPRVVARCEEKVDPLMHRLAKVFWRGSYERSLPVADDKTFDADNMVQLAHRVIEEKAKHGHCVIVGRGGPYILRKRHDTFRVFIFGSHQEKIRRLTGLKMQPKEAEEMVDTIDRERALFIRKYYNAEWPCRTLYHMMLNSDTGVDFVTETILHAMGRIEAARSFAAQHETAAPAHQSKLM
ncbi:MAG TPA: cytidylate kinase-like family protein [Candidatus Eisenbacteria bacterium]|nr:cytidylate kinase-like family protein [Candidatus Eisenbacteria bacterium]